MQSIQRLRAKKNHRLLDESSALVSEGNVLTDLNKFPEALACIREGLKLAEDPANEKNAWWTNIPWIKNPTPHQNRINAIAWSHVWLGNLIGATSNIDQEIAHLYLQIKQKDLDELVTINPAPPAAAVILAANQSINSKY